MKDKKIQIFISSTYTDLKEERQAAVEAILSAGHIPAGMELFSAGDESQMSVIKRWIDESDAYLLILGGRYGSIDKNSNKSYTHLEYEYALKRGKPLFAVVITENALESKVRSTGTSVIEKENTKELQEFKKLVCTNLVKFWDDKKDIKLAIHETISDFLYRKDLVGWIRSDKSVNTVLLAEEIARLTSENSELRKKLNETGFETHALYSGLPYTKIEELLKSEIISTSKGELTLFEQLLLVGEKLTQSISSPDNDSIIVLKRLIVYNLALYDNKYNIYQFTEDGHNFYVKALSEKLSVA